MILIAFLFPCSSPPNSCCCLATDYLPGFHSRRLRLLYLDSTLGDDIPKKKNIFFQSADNQSNGAVESLPPEALAVFSCLLSLTLFDNPETPFGGLHVGSLPIYGGGSS